MPRAAFDRLGLPALRRRVREGGLAHLVVGGRRLEVVEAADVAPHADDDNPGAGNRSRAGPAQPASARKSTYTASTTTMTPTSRSVQVASVSWAFLPRLGRCTSPAISKKTPHARPAGTAHPGTSARSPASPIARSAVPSSRTSCVSCTVGADEPRI